MKKILFAILFLSLCSASWAGTCGTTGKTGASPYTAFSCLYSDVNACVGQVSTGDTIKLPACPGGATWTSGITDSKGITFEGNGIDSTVIIDQSGGSLFTLSASTSKVLNMTLSQSASKTGAYTILVNYAKVRIGYVKFLNIQDGKRGVWVNSNQAGVIDNCIFTWTSNAQPIIFRDPRGTPAGSTSWTESVDQSTLFYVENTTFNGTQYADGIDCDVGGRYAFRYNTVYNISVGTHGCDSVTRSCRWVENYNNSYISTGDPYWGIQFRGGSGVVNNNTMTGYWGLPISVTDYRSQANAWPYCFNCMSANQPRCDGTSAIDGNTLPLETYRGWPCRDQIGIGANQASDPMYFWSNTYGGVAHNPVVAHNYGGTPDYLSIHVVLNRDYYNSAKPGWSAYTYPHPLREYGVIPDTYDPVVVILSPTSSDRWSQQSNTIGLGGTATDDVGVTAVTWSNSVGGSGSCTGTTTWVCSPVTLIDAGDNVVTISASDAAGNVGTDSVTIIYPGPDITHGHSIYIH